jgi:hypothetical protein
MWNVKAKALPVITGSILKFFRKNRSIIPGKHEIKGGGETPLDIAHILGAVLM